jgi:hypothetical protein
MNTLSPVQTANGLVPVQGSSSGTVASTPQKQPKPQPQHKDKLGRLIALDDFVAFPNHNGLSVGKIIKLNNKMVKILEIKKPTRYGASEYNKYPDDVVKLEQSDMTWYILKNSL